MTRRLAIFRAHLAHHLGALRRDRRGVTAAFFGVAAIAVIGMAGLATEVGYWYSVRRDAQNAADMAARAGAMRLGYANSANATDTNAQVSAAGRYVATRNGFTDTSGQSPAPARSFSVTVVPTTVAASGTYPGSSNAVRATIIQNEPRTISNAVARWFGGAGSQTQPIRATAVAAIQNRGEACILSLTDVLTIQGNTSLFAPTCVIASNSPAARDSCNLNGTSYQLDVAFINCFGGCDNCDRATSPAPASAPIPYADNTRVPVRNPFDEFDSVALPENIGSACPNGNGNNSPIGPVAVTAPNRGTLANQTYFVVCRDWDISGTVNLAPGTYYFPGTSLRLNNNATLNGPCNATLTCPPPTNPPRALGGDGVTLAFVPEVSGNGNNLANNPRVGEVDIRGGSTFNLAAPGPTASPRQPYQGLVIFRAADGNRKNKPFTIAGSPDISINGNTTGTRLAGGVYGVNSHINFNGNATIAQSGCLQVVGGRVTLSGTSQTSASRCAELNGNITEFVTSVFLVE